MKPNIIDGENLFVEQAPRPFENTATGNIVTMTLAEARNKNTKIARQYGPKGYFRPGVWAVPAPDEDGVTYADLKKFARAKGYNVRKDENGISGYSKGNGKVKLFTELTAFGAVNQLTELIKEDERKARLKAIHRRKYEQELIKGAFN